MAFLSFFLIVILGAAVGCTASNAPSSGQVVTSSANAGGAATSTTCKGVVLRLDSVGARTEKRAIHSFDVRLRNPASGPRWLIFPDAFPSEGKEEPAPGRGGIDRLRADRWGGRGRAVTVHATGPGGFRAVLLPPGGTAILNELPIFADWTAPRATAKIEVILAHDIVIDDAPVASWFKGALLADTDTDVSLGGDPRDQLQLAKPFEAAGSNKSVFSQGETTHTVSFQEDCRTTAQAVLKQKEL